MSVERQNNNLLVSIQSSLPQASTPIPLSSPPSLILPLHSSLLPSLPLSSHSFPNSTVEYHSDTGISKCMRAPDKLSREIVRYFSLGLTYNERSSQEERRDVGDFPCTIFRKLSDTGRVPQWPAHDGMGTNNSPTPAEVKANLAAAVDGDSNVRVKHFGYSFITRAKSLAELLDKTEYTTSCVERSRPWGLVLTENSTPFL